MKRITALILALALSASLFACGSPKHYTVTLDGGRQYVAVGQPEFDDDSKSYKFKDMDGNEVIVPQAQVQTIQQHTK